MGKEIVHPHKALLPLYNRYRNGVYWDDGEDSFVFREKEFSNIPQQPTDQWHTVTADTVRLDQISHLYYGTYVYWWIIAYANHIHDPYVPREIGTVLRIPDITKLNATDFFG